MFDVDIRGKKTVYLNGIKMKFIHESCRYVFVDKEKKYVLKMEQRLVKKIKGDSFNQCWNEYCLYKRLLKKDKKYFVKPLKFGFTDRWDYIIYPYIKQAHKRTAQYDSIIANITTTLSEKYGLWDLWTPNNCGVIDGKFLIWDYGVSD